MGTPDFAVPCVEALAAHPESELVAVVCQPDKVHGRHKTPQPPPVKEAAEHLRVEVFQPRRLKSGPFPKVLADLEPELIVVAAYGRILPQALLDLPRLGCVNVHASLLPRWRGAAPIQWSIAEGDAESGVCLMQMDAGLDTGDVLARAAVAIGPDETGQSLHDRLSRAGAVLLSEQLSALVAGDLTPIPQRDADATYARMLTRDDGHLDWTRPASEIERRMRAFYPWPGAFTHLDGAVFKVFPPAHADDAADIGAAAPGTVLDATSAGITVACGRGALTLTEVQKQGKRRMTAADFLPGHPLAEGTRFGSS